MHKVRRASLRAVLTSLLSGSHLSVTSLGRNIDSKTTEKHQIKRSMRKSIEINRVSVNRFNILNSRVIAAKN